MFLINLLIIAIFTFSTLLLTVIFIPNNWLLKLEFLKIFLLFRLHIIFRFKWLCLFLIPSISLTSFFFFLLLFFLFFFSKYFFTLSWRYPLNLRLFLIPLLQIYQAWKLFLCLIWILWQHSCCIRLALRFFWCNEIALLIISTKVLFIFEIKFHRESSF